MSNPEPEMDAAAQPADGSVRPDGVPSFSPLYQQIKQRLMAGLQSGDWRAGEAIPSELDLAARFGVSQGTVRKAIDELAAEHLLVRRQGKGTFVATHAEQRQQYRFLRLRPDDGWPTELGRQLLDCRRQKAPASVARHFQMKAGESMIQVRRLLHSQGQPVVLDDIWLPGELFKGLTPELLLRHRGPFYSLFETHFGVQMIRAQEKIRAVAADEETGRLLQVAVGAPLLGVERLSFTYGDRPVEFRRGLYHTEHHYYRNELN